jgi:cbb3-type cytochrome oxidase maturation protein
MDSLYLLIPLSVVIVLAIAGLLVWAAMSGQFEDLESEGRRILEEDSGAPDDGAARGQVEPSSRRKT